MNYSKEELIETFDLNQQYTLNELNEKIEEMYEIMIEKYNKKKVDTFLEQAKKKLIQGITQPEEELKTQEKYITPPKETAFIYTQPSNYFKGDLNPLEKRVVTRGICIDTLFRHNYFNTSSTDFMYEFPEYYKNIVSMKITAIEIPIVWYAFSSQQKNNTFIITIDNVKNTIVIPDGNYNSETMKTLMNGDLGEGILPPNILFNIDEITTKCSFKSVNTFTIDFLTNTPLCQTAGWALGFRKEKYTNKTIISESSYGSSFDNYFFLEIDDFQRNFISDSIVSVTNSGYIGKNIIARIPISTGFNAVTVSNDSDNLFKKRDYMGPVRLEKLHIRLLNRFGNIIDLNQNDYSFMIELQQLFS